MGIDVGRFEIKGKRRMPQNTHVVWLCEWKRVHVFYFVNVVSLDGPVDQAGPPALHAECWDQSVHNHAQLATYFLK